MREASKRSGDHTPTVPDELASRWLDDDYGDLSGDEITLVCVRLLELEQYVEELERAIKDYIDADHRYQRRIDTNELRAALEEGESGL